MLADIKVVKGIFLSWGL